MIYTFSADFGDIQATFFFARKALFERAEGLVEALRNGEVSGLAVEDGMDDRFELFELSLEVWLHLLRAHCALTRRRLFSNCCVIMCYTFGVNKYAINKKPIIPLSELWVCGYILAFSFRLPWLNR